VDVRIAAVEVLAELRREPWRQLRRQSGRSEHTEREIGQAASLECRIRRGRGLEDSMQQRTVFVFDLDGTLVDRV
jgi:hypothetical protein